MGLLLGTVNLREGSLTAFYSPRHSALAVLRHGEAEHAVLAAGVPRPRLHHHRRRVDVEGVAAGPRHGRHQRHHQQHRHGAAH